MALDHNGKVFVTDTSGDLFFLSLSTGIRPTCPLSPFVVMILLSALTPDLHSLLFQKKTQMFRGHFPFTPSTDAEYRLVIKHGNGSSPTNGGFSTNITYKWFIFHCHV